MKLGKREAQFLERGVSCGAMSGLLVSPADEALTVLQEVAFERGGRMPLGEDGLTFGDNVEVDQRELDLLQRALATEQGAVDPQLRPMQGTVIARDALQVAAIGFEFLELVGRGVIAISPPTDVEEGLVV